MLCNSLVCFVLVILTGIANGVFRTKETFTTSQKIIDLRERLKDDLTETYMISEYYLTNWLKSNQFNFYYTLLALEEYSELRTSHNVANIMAEDWSDMRALFPYSRNTTDKTGKPLLYIDIGQWDIGTYLTSKEGSMARLIRYVILMLEESEAHVRQLRADGQSIRQYSLLANIGGFSLAKHVCGQCATFYIKVADLLTPSTAANCDKVVLVNVPYFFKLVYFLWDDESQKLIQLHGQDQAHLEIMLNEYIDENQLPEGILIAPKTKDNSEGLMIWDSIFS